MFFHLPCRGMVHVQVQGSWHPFGSFCLCIKHLFNPLCLKRQSVISLFARYTIVTRDTLVSSCAQPPFPSKSATFIDFGFSLLLSSWSWVENGALLLYSDKEWIAHLWITLGFFRVVLLSGMGSLIVVCFFSVFLVFVPHLL